MSILLLGFLAIAMFAPQRVPLIVVVPVSVLSLYLLIYAFREQIARFSVSQANEKFESFSRAHPFLIGGAASSAFLLGFLTTQALSGSAKLEEPWMLLGVTVVIALVIGKSLKAAQKAALNQPGLEQKGIGRWSLQEMNNASFNFPASLFAVDRLGHSLNMVLNNGTAMQLLDDGFPVPASTNRWICLEDGETADEITVSLYRDTESAFAKYRITNIQNLHGKPKVFQIKINVDRDKNISLTTKAPLAVVPF